MAKSGTQGFETPVQDEWSAFTVSQLVENDQDHLFTFHSWKTYGFILKDMQSLWHS